MIIFCRILVGTFYFTLRLEMSSVNHFAFTTIRGNPRRPPRRQMFGDRETTTTTVVDVGAYHITQIYFYTGDWSS